MKNFIDVVATEDEQLEQLKSWWKKNATSIIVGIAIAIIGSVSWKGYQSHQYSQQLEARVTYLEFVATKDPKMLEIMKSEYSNSSYLPYAKLFMAKEHFDNQKYSESLVLLEDIKNEAVEFLQHLARLRIATVYLAQNKYTKALAELNSVAEKGTFLGEYQALKGDIYFFKKDKVKAKAFYQKAIKNTINESAQAVLSLKMNDL